MTASTNSELRTVEFKFLYQRNNLFLEQQLKQPSFPMEYVLNIDLKFTTVVTLFYWFI